MKVPDGMLKAAWAVHEDLRDNQGVNEDQFRRCLEVALEWLVANPIEPTVEQALRLREVAIVVSLGYGSQEITAASCAAVACEWQRMMFLEAEEPPEEIRDLLYVKNPLVSEEFNRRIIEAFRRGRG